MTSGAGCCDLHCALDTAVLKDCAFSAKKEDIFYFFFFSQTVFVKKLSGILRRVCELVNINPVLGLKAGQLWVWWCGGWHRTGSRRIKSCFQNFNSVPLRSFACQLACVTSTRDAVNYWLWYLRLSCSCDIVVLFVCVLSIWISSELTRCRFFPLRQSHSGGSIIETTHLPSSWVLDTICM